MRSRFVLGLALAFGPGPPVDRPAVIRFEDRPRSSGISFVLDNGTTPDKPVIEAVLGGFATLMMSGWGTGAYDFDNDGQKELFSANSHVSASIDTYGHHRYRQANAVFRGRGRGRRRCSTT